MSRLTPEFRFLLRFEGIRPVFDAQHLLQHELARRLEVSANYWSQLVHRRRHLTPRVRRALLAAFPGVPEDELWDKIRVRCHSAADAT